MAEWMNAAASYGITPVFILGAIGTIIASFFSARWGAAENRKQFQKKTEDDQRTAAAELIPLLMAFAAQCDERKYNLSTYISSGGQDGADEPMSGTTFDNRIFERAARLGPRITERAIKLQLIKMRAESFVWNASGYVDGDELNEAVLSYFALLSLRARTLADMASKTAGFEMLHPDDDLERLRAEAIKHSFEIDSGDDKRWY